MNRKDRRKQEAKTRQGQGPDTAQLAAKLWDKIHAAEAKTASEMLSGEVTRAKVIEVVDNALNFASGFNDERRYIACGEGCHFCCHQKVGTTAIEIVYITTYLREMRTEEQRRALATALGEVAAKRSTSETHAARCPMLSESGGCTIYEVRPLACRSVTSESSEPCRQWLEDGKNLGKVADRRRYVGHHATMHGLDKGTSSRGLQGGFLDFHHALYKALSDPTAIERWYAGEHVFGAATVPPKVRRLPLI